MGELVSRIRISPERIVSTTFGPRRGQTVSLESTALDSPVTLRVERPNSSEPDYVIQLPDSLNLPDLEVIKDIQAHHDIVQVHRDNLKSTLNPPEKYSESITHVYDGGLTLWKIIDSDHNIPGNLYIIWGDYEEEKGWMLVVDSLSWKCTRGAKWDDEEGIKRLVFYLENPQSLMTELALSYPEDMALLTQRRANHLEWLERVKLFSSI